MVDVVAIGRCIQRLIDFIGIDEDMIEYLTTLKLGVLLLGDISLLNFIRFIFSPYINVEETILASVEGAIMTYLLEQSFLVVVVE